MSKAKYKIIVVKKSASITPHMQRITFTGDDLADFPDNYESGYVKLLFSPDGKAISDRHQTEEEHLRRTYTVRSFNRAANELAIEFSLHGDKNGPAAAWAESTQPGDRILMAGPGPAKLVKNESDWFLLAGDMSGLPALCCNLEQLPNHAKGYAVIEVPSEADKQDLTVPEGITVKWVISNPGENSDALLDEIKPLDWKDGDPYVWVACEFNSMKKIRQYMKDVHSIKQGNIYISSYWKFDRTEDEHRMDKRMDSMGPVRQFIGGMVAGVQKMGLLSR
ncbi:MAG: siderophore-interacting protein [Cyanobacteria bacterium P01_F01_bin.150]